MSLIYLATLLTLFTPIFKDYYQDEAVKQPLRTPSDLLHNYDYIVGKSFI